MALSKMEDIKVALQSIQKNHLSTIFYGLQLEWNQKTENIELCKGMLVASPGIQKPQCRQWYLHRS